MSKYTVEDLVLYLYNDHSLKHKAGIETALESDWTLREKLAVLKASKERLNNIVTSPRSEVLLNVIKYATQKQVATL
jgi:hypothetical protein